MKELFKGACRGTGRRTAFIACSFAAVVCAQPAHAGKARDYLNAPKNTWVTFYNAGYSTYVTPVEGGEDFGVPEIGADVYSQSVIITRVMDFWGRTGGVSVIVPYLNLSLDASGYQAQQAGVGDLSFALETNLFGAPALSKEEFKSWTPQPFASIHFVLTAPTGSYDADNVLNVGSNRWIFTPTINYSYTPNGGRTWLEAYGSTKLFSENKATKTEQDPLLLIEGHASQNLTDKIWLSVDAYYNVGGETRVSGVAQDNAADTLRLGVGAGIRLWSGAQLMLNYDQVVIKPDSQPEGRSVRLSLAQVW
ncbi:MAG: transporter [Cyanobium sp.]|nr:transporter [Synechococcus sp. CS-1325]MCT0213107.1 transporter [Synechococcus sp. CS-1326]PZV02816.1 MAG: transporter [Cyanobium sp.]